MEWKKKPKFSSRRPRGNLERHMTSLIAIFIILFNFAVLISLLFIVIWSTSFAKELFQSSCALFVCSSASLALFCSTLKLRSAWSGENFYCKVWVLIRGPWNKLNIWSSLASVTHLLKHITICSSQTNNKSNLFLFLLFLFNLQQFIQPKAEKITGWWNFCFGWCCLGLPWIQPGVEYGGHRWLV